jgi:hypothetical protein
MRPGRALRTGGRCSKHLTERDEPRASYDVSDWHRGYSKPQATAGLRGVLSCPEIHPGAGSPVPMRMLGAMDLRYSRKAIGPGAQTLCPDDAVSVSNLRGGMGSPTALLSQYATILRTDPGSLVRSQAHLETLGRVAFRVHETSAGLP